MFGIGWLIMSSTTGVDGVHAGDVRSLFFNYPILHERNHFLPFATIASSILWDSKSLIFARWLPVILTISGLGNSLFFFCRQAVCQSSHTEFV